MKTCHGAERKTSSWAGPNWCLMKDMGPGGKRISGPGGAGGWGQADGEQLGPDTHSWRHGAMLVPSVCLGTKRIMGWMLHPQHDPTDGVAVPGGNRVGVLLLWCFRDLPGGAGAPLSQRVPRWRSRCSLHHLHRGK